MILINHNPMQAEELLREYPPDHIYVTITNIMSSSLENYSYDSLEELKFELLFREEIVSAANKLSHSGLKFRVFRKSICNEKYWNRNNDGGFELRKDVSASEAIHDIFLHGSKYGTECATALLIVYFGGLSNVFSNESFDKTFSTIRLMNWHQIHGKLREVGSVKKATDFLPGDRRYFKNPDVDPLTPEWQGENVIEMGNGYYYGHALGVARGKRFIDGLNKKRKRNAKKSAYLMDSVGKPNFKNLSTLYTEFSF